MAAEHDPDEPSIDDNPDCIQATDTRALVTDQSSPTGAHLDDPDR